MLSFVCLLCANPLLSIALFCISGSLNWNIEDRELAGQSDNSERRCIVEEDTVEVVRLVQNSIISSRRWSTINGGSLFSGMRKANTQPYFIH